jgi:mannan endo-1,4-beta-mannosidase
MERYPGDDYVDILGYDCYQYTKGNNREGYMERMNKMLTYLTDLGEKHQKPIACTETGFEAIPSEDWWTGVLQPCTQNHPAAFVVVWRNAHTPFTLISGEPLRQRFLLYYKNSKTLFCSDLKEVYEVKGNDSLNQK